LDFDADGKSTKKTPSPPPYSPAPSDYEIVLNEQDVILEHKTEIEKIIKCLKNSFPKIDKILPNIPYGTNHTLDATWKQLNILREVENIADATFPTNIHYNYIKAHKDYFHYLSKCNHGNPFDKNTPFLCDPCFFNNYSIKDLYSKDILTQAGVNTDNLSEDEDWEARD
jgi:hypothetical protein